MKRNLTSRLISSQEVCLFCAFRPSQDAIARPWRLPVSNRQYSSSKAKRSPVGVATAQRQEDEDEEPPMLRQNADLASSFPSQRPKLQSLSSPTSYTHSRTDGSSNFNPKPNGQGKHRDRLAQKDGPTFRNNFQSMHTKKNPNQFRIGHQNDSVTNEGRPSFVRDGSFQRSDQQPRGPPRRDRSGPRSVADGDLAKGRQGSPVWRFKPSQDIADHRPQRSHPFQNVGTSDQDRRSFPRSSAGPERSQSQERPQNLSPAFRRANLSPAAEDISWSPINGNLERGIDRQDQRGIRRNDNNNPNFSGSVGGKEYARDSVETPVPVNVDTDDHLPGFHHRRGTREDKRKDRSSRYEFEEEGDAGSVSLPATAKEAPSTRGRMNSRATSFDYEMAEAEEALYGDSNRRRKKGKAKPAREVEKSRPSVKISDFMSVAQLAKALGVHVDSFIQTLEQEGFESPRYDHILPASDSSMLADIYGFDPIVAEEESSLDLTARPLPEDSSTLPPRPPIVTIMGHVDHGKTTILDYLRKSSVVATEHGGITQHIGAFSVTMPGTNRQITFLDTPGHAAFLEMRRRGANVTDIVVLVVAADDSVKPQTIEAIKHAIEAKVQIIVAINKVDKEDADINRVKQDLARHDIVVEDYGGDYQAVSVSGKTGQGMEELEEAIITQADVNDYRAEIDGQAEGTIIESKVTAAGRVATILVRRGTLRTGDFIVAGTTWARVRTLRDDTGALVTEAPPGTPVQVDGWRGEDPTAGLEVIQAESEQQAKDVIDYRIDQRDNLRISTDMAVINESRTEEADARAKILEWESQQEWARRSHGRRPKDNAGWVEPEATSGPKQVHFVVKADVAGSVEAVVAAVTAVGNNEITANVIHSGTGQVTESDVRMLATTGETGYAISFNQPLDGTIVRLAEAAGLQILDHNIIYKVTDAVKEKLSDQLPPNITQKVHGEAEIGQVFEVTIKKNKVKVAGCKVTNGTISRANKVRVSRDGSVVYTGTLHSLKNVKKDVTEMRKGSECGMGFENWDDFQEGDQIQCFEEHEERRTLY